MGFNFTDDYRTLFQTDKIKNFANLERLSANVLHINGLVGSAGAFTLYYSSLDLHKNHLIIMNDKEEAIYLNWARTMVRRVERRIVGLGKVVEVRGELLKYFNRLSDYLFIKARQEEEKN